MKRFSHLPEAHIILLAGSSVLLALAAVGLPRHGQPDVKATTPRQVADTLDRLIQPRFLRFDLGFGVMDRLVRVSGHNAVRLRLETPEEKRLLAGADAAQRDYLISFLHCRHVPATAYRNVRGQTVKIPSSTARGEDRPILRYVAGRESAQRRSNDYSTFNMAQSGWQKAAVKDLPRLMHGGRVNADAGGWLLAMRPVRASRKECLGCHTNSRMGDTLGVMVYAVSKQITPSR